MEGKNVIRLHMESWEQTAQPKCLRRLVPKNRRIIYVICPIAIFCYNIFLFHAYSSFSLIVEQASAPPDNAAVAAMLMPYNYTDARVLLAPSFRQCPNVSVFYIIRTHPRNLRWRNIVRSTWAGSLKNSLIFALGIEKVGQVTKAVQREAKKYDDLIVFDMIDTYSNMTLKSVNILRWISRSCHAPRFFMQGDPDIAAFPDKIELFTSKLDPNSIALYGKCWKGARAQRQDSSKWNLNPFVYASVTYPTYLAGGAWFFTPTTADRLLVALKWPLSYIHIDDMLISGIFAELMDVQRVCLNNIGRLDDFKNLSSGGCPNILAVLQLEEEDILKTILDYREAMMKCRSGVDGL